MKRGKDCDNGNNMTILILAMTNVTTTILDTMRYCRHIHDLVPGDDEMEVMLKMSLIMIFLRILMTFTNISGMWLMLQQDKPDDFVLATGHMHSVREFVEVVVNMNNEHEHHHHHHHIHHCCHIKQHHRIINIHSVRELLDFFVNSNITIKFIIIICFHFKSLM